VSVVLDSSITVAWLYREETSQAADEIFANLIHTGAWIPALWHLEVANVLQIGIRRQRHAADFRDRMFSDLSHFPIHVDPETHRQAWAQLRDWPSVTGLRFATLLNLEIALRRKISAGYARPADPRRGRERWSSVAWA
jgi:predicted nucleic acid-binding protein